MRFPVSDPPRPTALSDIGILTNGRVYRDELEEYAVIMALTKIVSKNIYE